jgi:hypothetical protein
MPISDITSDMTTQDILRHEDPFRGALIDLTQAGQVMLVVAGPQNTEPPVIEH